MKYKNIIFDVDGTLINTTTANLLSLQEALILDGKREYSFNELMAYDGLPGKNTLEIIGVSDIEVIHKKWLQLTEHRRYMFEVYYGIHPTLKTLKSSVANLSIVTSRSNNEVASDMTLNGLISLFDIIVTSDLTEKHKPNPEPLLYAIEKGHYLPSETLYVGDSVYDFKAACGANIAFAKALWGLKTFDIRVQDYALKQPLDLLKIL